MENEKIVAAIYHASWILISAGVVSGKKISCPKDMAVDVSNPGGIWKENPCTRDENLVTAVYNKFLPEHLRAAISAIEEW
jgi:protease I